MLPFLTAYDPPGTSEGTLDPMGLYQIADQLAVQLVPAVRERMQRIRFLTAMAVGAMVTDGLEDDPRNRDASPYLVWEWLLVEAMVRQLADDEGLWGVPGTLMARRAVPAHGYLDARSYLKTPRIFGLHGVYKRLAVHLGVTDVHLGIGPQTEPLSDAWARGLGLSGLDEAKPILSRWRSAVARSLGEKPPRTKPSWGTESWRELAEAFAPWMAKAREKRQLRDLLLAGEDRRLGALPTIWELQPHLDGDNFQEEELHNRLEEREPAYGPLLAAIRAYEAFARSLHDGFDILKAEAAIPDARGFDIRRIAEDRDFRSSIHGLHDRFVSVQRALSEVPTNGLALQNLFDQRFGSFADRLGPGDCALLLCRHHEAVQRAKSADGKRPWFDRIGPERIYIRHQYREKRRPVTPGQYVHDYRGRPIRRFHADLT